MIFKLIDKGLLCDENGNMSNRMKIKILELLGYGLWENAQDQNELHIKKAGKENLAMLKDGEAKVSEIDNHDLHINEHICFMLSQEFEDKCKKDEFIEERFLNHIREHKKYLKNEE